MDPTKITKKVEEIVEDIREFSRLQKEVWQRVPYLALEADGRIGHWDNYGRAYGTGYWALQACAEGGYFSVYVDLATGELVNAFSVLKPANDRNVLSLALKLEQLDAQGIVDHLEKKAKQPYGSYYDPEEKEKWRNELRDKLSLQEIYVRN